MTGEEAIGLLDDIARFYSVREVYREGVQKLYRLLEEYSDKEEFLTMLKKAIDGLDHKAEDLYGFGLYTEKFEDENAFREEIIKHYPCIINAIKQMPLNNM